MGGDTIVSSPDPTSKEEKGLVTLGRILGPVLRNFHAPMRSQLCSVTWQAYRRNATSLYSYISYSISLTNQVQDLLYRQLRSHANTAIATNQNQALHGLVGACHRARTEDSAQVHQTLFPLRGWGLGTRLVILWGQAKCPLYRIARWQGYLQGGVSLHLFITII